MRATDVTHVDNVMKIAVAGLDGCGGEAYFVTDGKPVVFRGFVTALLNRLPRSRDKFVFWVAVNRVVWCRSCHQEVRSVFA